MLAKRIIPCLDVKDARVVKGVRFLDLRDAGDPVECAAEYDRQNADEIVFLDITASHEGRGTMADVVRKTARRVHLPLTVGGGIRSVADFGTLLCSGADKVSVNSAAVKDPQLLSRAAEKYGSQCVVLAIDAKYNGAFFEVYINGGRIPTGKDAAAWAAQGVALGAGEILITSMDTDGTKNGFDLTLTQAICNAVRVPVIASGGCGKLSDFSDLFEKTGADAALAASLFHYKELCIDEVKAYLESRSIAVRR